MIEAGVIGAVALGIVAMAVVLALYHGFVLWVLWGWFIVPLGAPQIGIAWAIGIAVVVNTMQSTPPPAHKEGARQHGLVSLLKPALALVIGWIAKQFM